MDINKRIEQLEKELEILKADVKKENDVWKPKEKEYYYCIKAGFVYAEEWNDIDYDRDALAIGNVFQSRKAAEFEVEKMRVEQELRKFCRPFKNETYNWCLQYNHINKELWIVHDYSSETQGVLYFDSEEEAHKAISEIGEDRILKYIFGVEE